MNQKQLIAGAILVMTVTAGWPMQVHAFGGVASGALGGGAQGALGDIAQGRFDGMADGRLEAAIPQPEATVPEPQGRVRATGQRGVQKAREEGGLAVSEARQTASETRQQTKARSDRLRDELVAAPEEAGSLAPAVPSPVEDADTTGQATLAAGLDADTSLTTDHSGADATASAAPAAQAEGRADAAAGVGASAGAASSVEAEAGASR